MKKLFYFLIFLFILGCAKDEFETPLVPDSNKLEIASLEGLKFQGSDITDGSLWNFKTQSPGLYNLEIKNHFGELISKSIVNVKMGDNVREFYTRALKDGDYTILIIKENDIIHERKLTIR